MMDALAPSHSKERFSMSGTIPPDAVAPGVASRPTGSSLMLTLPVARAGERSIVRGPLAAR
jgi:hypothetical protein